jgi:hypothetical protein
VPGPQGDARGQGSAADLLRGRCVLLRCVVDRLHRRPSVREGGPSKDHRARCGPAPAAAFINGPAPLADAGCRRDSQERQWDPGVPTVANSADPCMSSLTFIASSGLRAYARPIAGWANAAAPNTDATCTLPMMLVTAPNTAASGLGPRATSRHRATPPMMPSAAPRTRDEVACKELAPVVTTGRTRRSRFPGNGRRHLTRPCATAGVPVAVEEVDQIGPGLGIPDFLNTENVRRRLVDRRRQRGQLRPGFQLAAPFVPGPIAGRCAGGPRMPSSGRHRDEFASGQHQQAAERICTARIRVVGRVAGVLSRRSSSRGRHRVAVARNFYAVDQKPLPKLPDRWAGRRASRKNSA